MAWGHGSQGHILFERNYCIKTVSFDNFILISLFYLSETQVENVVIQLSDRVEEVLLSSAGVPILTVQEVGNLLQQHNLLCSIYCLRVEWDRVDYSSLNISLKDTTIVSRKFFSQ